MSNPTAKNSFLVQVARYRDPQLIPTLLDMANQADHPENLKVTVAWQHGPDQPLQDFIGAGFKLEKTEKKDVVVPIAAKEEVDHDENHILSYKKMQVRLIDIPYLKSQGACWARFKIQQYYNKEKYTLQLDSHHRFEPHFDTTLVEMLESLRYRSKKPLLTTYTSSFDPANDPEARITTPWRMSFDRFIPEGTVFFIPESIDDWKERTEPVLSRFYSAHFAFADGSFAEEVQHDPNFFFHGEEMSIAVRAFTHGYDLYNPHKVLCYHEYTRKGRVKIWDDHNTRQKNKGKIKLDWVERNNASHKRDRVLFGMDGEDPKSVNFGKFGFGTERSLKDYEEFSGISFKYRSVQQQVLDRVYPELIWRKYASEEEWKSTLTRSNDIRVLVHKSELGEPTDDYDFWFIAAVTLNPDGTDNIIYRRDYDEQEVKELLKNDYTDKRLIFYSKVESVRTHYIVWPHSKSKGWMNKIVKKAD